MSSGRINGNVLIYAACGLVVLIIALRAIFSPPLPYVPQASASELATFATATLAGVQRQSIARNQEYCGVIIESDEGELSSSGIYQGGRGACSFLRMRNPGSHVIASFHTHGGVDPDYDSEFPSVEDLSGDIDERITGFIATPGGRIWQTDWRSGKAEQLCGTGCIEQDPDFAANPGDAPEQSYSLDELRRRFSGPEF